MSELLQSGRHPDADQLSAFIEHALPAHEYQQTLAHLADCADCRTIVSLSLPPVDESPVLQAKPVRSSWFSGWNLAWPAAAAVLATLAIFVVHIHNTITTRRAGTTAQMAESQGPAALAATERPSIPSQDSKPRSSNRRGAIAQAGAGGSISQITSAAHEAQSKSALALQSPSVPGLLQLPPGPPTGSSAGSGTTQPQNLPGTAVDQVRQNALRSGNTVEAGPSASEATAPPITNAYGQANAATASPSRSASEGVLGGALGQPVEVRNTTPVAALSTINNGSLLSQAQSIVAQHPLPSHLPALSMVSSAQNVLAIDTRNTLFFSDDAGNHWKATPSPWEGRAVKVELASSTIPSKQSPAAETAQPHPGLGFGVAGGIAGSEARVNSIRTIAQQSLATLTGTVKDTSGAVIQGAPVVVSNSTTVTSPSKTDSAGRYIVNDLAPGSYQVEVLAPGFEEQQITVTLTASQRTVANFTLSIGQVSQSVTVQAAASSPINISPARKKTAEPPPASEPLTHFEITTDTGEHWTSTDGQIWTRR